MSSWPIDPIAAAEFIVRRLYRPLDFANARCMAAAETEHPFAGDNWFWTDDNAKVVEFLLRPELGGRYAGEAEAILGFIRAMCRGPFILRRVSGPRLELTGRKDNEASYYHSLLHLRTDLSLGIVIAGTRFHDNRTADNLLLGTNCVEFSYRGRKYTVPVEKTIDAAAGELEGHLLKLRYAAELHFTPRRRPMRVGRISYVYTIDARSMAINVEAVLEVDAAADILDVVLTIGHDYLSHGGSGVHYNRILTEGGAEALRFAAAAPGRQFLPAEGAGYYSIVQSELAGFALAVHSAPCGDTKLSELVVLVRYPGYLHLARARYRFAGSCRGRRLVVSEDKMLTAGGFYDRAADYGRLLRDAVADRGSQDTAIDFSVSYDYGAELNAFARYFMFLAERDGPGAGPATEAKALFDFYLDAYCELFVERHYRNEDIVFSRQIAFVILGLIAMCEATGGGYRERLAELCNVLLAFEKRFDDIAGAPVGGFLMGARTGRNVYVDCHSAAMLALTEAVRFIDDPRIAPAIDRGLGSYSLETARIEWHDGLHKVDVISADWVDDAGNRQRNIGFWNYHTGLMLRLFGALRRTADPALQAVAARHRDRIELFERIMRWHLERSLSWHDGAVEIRSSILSTETNSETQPWAAVGLIERGWA